MPVVPQEWHYRQSIEYEMTQNRAIMDLASRYRETWLFNIWRMGMNSIEKGSTGSLDRDAQAHRGAGSGSSDRCAGAAGGGRGGRGGRGGGAAAAPAAGGDVPAGGGTFGGTARAIPTDLYNTILHDPKLRDPRGYIIPADQADFATATEFVNALLKNGITVWQARTAFPVAGKTYPAGSYVVKSGAGLPPARHGHVRAAGPSQRFRLSRRPAQASLRHHRLDSGHADGRAVRSHPGGLRRPIHKDQRVAAAAREVRRRARRIRRAT